MRKWLVLPLLLGLLLFPSKARAQSGVKLDTMKVQLWSEYDQPSMLVINQFVVSKGTTLPVTITLRFPKDANLTAVAVDKQNGPFNKDFTGPVAQGDYRRAGRPRHAC